MKKGMEKGEYLYKAAFLNFVRSMDKVSAVYRSWGKEDSNSSRVYLSNCLIKFKEEKKPD